MDVEFGVDEDTPICLDDIPEGNDVFQPTWFMYSSYCDFRSVTYTIKPTKSQTRWSKLGFGEDWGKKDQNPISKQKRLKARKLRKKRKKAKQ